MFAFGKFVLLSAPLWILAACGGDSNKNAPSSADGPGGGEAHGAAAAGAGAQQVQPGQGEFVAYRETLVADGPGFDLVPIAGGTFLMGSPASEPGRNDDEGPQVEVRLEPFWMASCEISWDCYDVWNTDESRPQSKKPDGVARPTPAYMEMTFGMGRFGYPAICMSHVAARQYCKWLSEKTGHFYRLPTEAEWEYACRAGTETAYSTGDDPKQLDPVAWYVDNSARSIDGGPLEPMYAKIGTKKPNAFGLFDMHGNVAEWVADNYLADAYAPAHGAAPRVAPYFAPERDSRDRPKRFGHVVRGGSWRDPAPLLRSAARRASEPQWNERDPQVPKSWWYLTEGQHVGFRVVRPLREPTAEERARFENP
ncbi:MAG: formylglycine-generating enzyme family protein [Planctomycetes bacterium]|nr:formylglycine-generating enzyme family protein [Planctomycetota bacterium]